MAKDKPDPDAAPARTLGQAPAKLDLDTMQKEAIRLAKIYDEDVDPSQCVTEVTEDLGNGNLVIVYDESQNNEEYYVHFAPGRQPKIFGYVRDYAPWLAEVIRRRNWWQSASDVGAVFIGVVITVTICGMSAFHPKGSPEILNNALTTIIGFYFGTQIARGNQAS